MSIYIDREYESETLADLLVEAQRIAREAWYREVEDRVIYQYRDLAKDDVRSGAPVTDHPMFSPLMFVKLPHDTTDDRLVKVWEGRLVHELTIPCQLFVRTKGDHK